MQKALKALLVADEPLGATEIIERAGISERSYTRNIDELAAVGLVEATGNGGHKTWQAWLIPWWSPLAGVDAPRTADSDDESTLARPSRWDDILYRIALDLDLDSEYELFAGQVDIEDVFAALPALDRWRGFLEAHYGLGSASTTAANADNETDGDRRSTSGTLDTSHTVEIGAFPVNCGRERMSLDAARQGHEPLHETSYDP